MDQDPPSVERSLELHSGTSSLGAHSPSPEWHRSPRSTFYRTIQDPRRVPWRSSSIEHASSVRAHDSHAVTQNRVDAASPSNPVAPDATGDSGRVSAIDRRQSHDGRALGRPRGEARRPRVPGPFSLPSPERGGPGYCTDGDRHPPRGAQGEGAVRPHRRVMA